MSSAILPRLPRAWSSSPCMKKLDALGWSAGLRFTAHGVRIGVRVTDPSVLGDVEARLPVGWRRRTSPRVDHLVSLVVGDREPRGSIRRLHLVYAGGLRAFRTTDLGNALGFLEYHLEEFVAQMAPDRIFVHAGVVGWKGKAILIPGRSHSGKTSLVTALLEAGATYYSDEFAMLDAKGRVHPYLRRLRIRDGAEDEGRLVHAEEIGAASGRTPLPVALVAAARYVPGKRWRPRRLSPGAAVLELFSHTVPARFRPSESLGVLRQVVRRAATFKGTRGEARETAASLLAAVS
jgi:hypothetical protein